MKQFPCADHSDFVQIAPKLAKDFINQIAVPVKFKQSVINKSADPCQATWTTVGAVYEYCYSTPECIKERRLACTRNEEVSPYVSTTGLWPSHTDAVLEGIRTIDSSRRRCLSLPSRFFSSVTLLLKC